MFAGMAFWEQHGEAREPSCRVLDDFLEGTQNATVGYQHTHRPANLDSLAATFRAMGALFPEKIMLFTSDFAKAFKQIPGVVSMLECSVVAQWDPCKCRPAFMVPLTQVFGGRSTPLNFARYPSWCCYAMACLGALPAEHCVDDIITAERASTIQSGWRLWRTFADLCGWRVLDTKSPPPTTCQTVLGAQIDTRQFPQQPVVIRITLARSEVLLGQLHEILVADRLAAGLAGQLWGKLQHACCMLWGRYGAAKLRPLARRQRDGYLTLNPQLRSSIEWWIATLQANKFPRQVSLFWNKRTMISYSDGEGADAVVGVGLWIEGSPTPLAAYLKVPRELRLLWAQQRARCTDIFQIEAIGPLVVLATWPELVLDCLWIHFIDNAAALSALVNGSSSVASGDLIVGLAWEVIASRCIYPWFDRVDSKSNPVDGLSRGNWQGPWSAVTPAILPGRLLRQLRASHFQ